MTGNIADIASGLPRIVLVGAGGLGGPVAFALRAQFPLAGLRIFDHDTIDISNLHRQLQFSDADLGRNKATLLADQLGATGYSIRWDESVAELHCQDCDIIIDTSDSPSTKFAVSDWATATGRPFVIAAAQGVAGSVMSGAPGYACFRCWFESPPIEAVTCADAGVLGPVLAMVAAVAVENASVLLSGDRSVAGTLWRCDDLAGPLLQGDLPPSSDPSALNSTSSAAEPPNSPHRALLARDPASSPRQTKLAPRPDCTACIASAMPPTQQPVVWATSASDLHPGHRRG
jgi:molybdopterin-synthase adenylyltransferase